MFKSINCEQSAEISSQPGLEYWFKERRTDLLGRSYNCNDFAKLVELETHPNATSVASNVAS